MVARGDCVAAPLVRDDGSVFNALRAVRIVFVARVGRVSTTSDSSAVSVRSVVAWADVMSVMVVTVSSNNASGGSRDSKTGLSVLGIGIVGGLGLALPELAVTSGTSSVAVGGRWAESLLALVVTVEEELYESRKEEDECANDGNNEGSLLEPAGKTVVSLVGNVRAVESIAALVGLAAAKRSVERLAAVALVRTITGENSHRDESTHEEKIKEYAQEREDGLAAKETGQQNSEESVKDSSAGHTLNSLLPCWNVSVAISKHREEIAEDAQDNSSATECESVEESLQRTECCSAQLSPGHYDYRVWWSKM